MKCLACSCSAVAGRGLVCEQVNDGIVAFDRGLHEVIDVVDSWPHLSSYLVVLGIADYEDGCKGRGWQPYAGLAAAAFAKSIISALSSRPKRSYYRR